jgi:hypothetical protein
LDCNKITFLINILSLVSIDLGQGVKTTNPEDAGELLMKREYPDILNCEKEPHEVQFLPDCYLYGELTLKVCSLFFL